MLPWNVALECCLGGHCFPLDSLATWGKRYPANVISKSENVSQVQLLRYILLYALVISQ
ncbi:hypothetical protein BDN67DRAFT_974962 [Paxillus ammoniavirescens]|nr:hypothetical protein BDN67DRAFT_974962 [Paxillus ammoniavirescens]